MRRNLQPIYLVLVNNIGSPVNLWPKAIVRHASYGPGGRVKTVRLKIATEEIGRDVRNLCLLEEADYLNAIAKPGRCVLFGGMLVMFITNQSLLERPIYQSGLMCL
ncbi:unnamed protein product [Schistosoma rodhaini]|uniref:DUF5641 domain-containing protein n=1 Tax=Schistosoma rodhaini TaxID=6188 RepID=A0AA85F3D8_9TREM|nr:unnamed protein product [Schistosoma rodhaini]